MSKIKTINKLPISILIGIAKIYGHRNPEIETLFSLAQFISDSLGEEKFEIKEETIRIESA